MGWEWMGKKHSKNRKNWEKPWENGGSLDVGFGVLWSLECCLMLRCSERVSICLVEMVGLDFRRLEQK